MTKVLSSYEKRLNQAKMPAGKKKVLLAALHLFASHGFHATTTAKIAKEAGVSEGTIYKYFPSKEELLNHLMTPLLEGIRNSFFAKLQRPQSLDDLIDVFIQDRIEFGTENFELIKILLQELLTGKSSFADFKQLFEGTDGLYARLDQIKHSFSEINDDLSPEQIIRIFLGPIMVYLGQVNLLKDLSDNRAFDLQLIHRQIYAGLTTK